MSNQSPQNHLSDSTLEILGLTQWHLKPQFSQLPQAEDVVEERLSVNQNVDSLNDTDASQAVSVNAKKVEYDDSLSSEVPIAPIVWVGSDLNDIWQNESSPEWLLLMNILKAFDIAQERLMFFDTLPLATEDALFTTLEEIIESGAEHVFAFDETDPLVEKLLDGVEVILLPSLTDLLYSSTLKKQLYGLLCEVPFMY